MAKIRGFDAGNLLQLLMFAVVGLVVFNLLVDTSGEEWQLKEFGLSQTSTVVEVLIVFAMTYVGYAILFKRTSISKKDLVGFGLALFVLWFVGAKLLPGLTDGAMSLTRLAFAIAGGP